MDREERQFRVAELLLTLDAGAIVLMATFMSEPVADKVLIRWGLNLLMWAFVSFVSFIVLKYFRDTPKKPRFFKYLDELFFWFGFVCFALAVVVLYKFALLSV